jgi:hypothetical protein
MVTKARAALQTFHALQASDLAAAFNEALRRVHIGPGDYVAELTVPAGPSTAGGVQAMQHVRLIPRDARLPTLVVGHANHAEERAELKTYEHLDAVYRQRFRRPIAIDRAQYDHFLRVARQILDVLRLKTTIAGVPAELELEGRRSRAGTAQRTWPTGRWLILVATVIVVASSAYALWRTGVWRALARS